MAAVAVLARALHVDIDLQFVVVLLTGKIMTE